MKKVFHFVPSLDIGGVEIAMVKSLPDLRRRLDVSVFYVRRRGSLDVGQVPWWRALKHMFVARPDVVITSMYWAHPLGLLFNLFGIKWVCFIHSPGFVHLADRIVCLAAIRLANEIAAHSTHAQALLHLVRRKTHLHVVPCIFAEPMVTGACVRVQDSFIYVGRGTKEKRLDLVVAFFEHLLEKFPDVSCRFIMARRVPATVLALGQTWGKRVTVEENLSNIEVMNRLYASEYFVALSDYESFCMAAHEAIQAGCFVVYRDVGEIKHHVAPEKSFHVTDLANLYEEFDEILVRRMRNRPMDVNIAALGPGSHPRETYVSCFMRLV